MHPAGIPALHELLHDECLSGALVGADAKHADDVGMVGNAPEMLDLLAEVLKCLTSTISTHRMGETHLRGAVTNAFQHDFDATPPRSLNLAKVTAKGLRDRIGQDFDLVAGDDTQIRQGRLSTGTP